MHVIISFYTLRPRQSGRHLADDTFKRIFLNENAKIWTKISLTFISKDPINNIAALPETMMVRLQTHICVSQPQ